MNNDPRAGEWLAKFKEQSEILGIPWKEPFVGHDEDWSCISFDWWNGERALGVYVTNDEIFFIRDWGVGAGEMEDGDAESVENQCMLLTWLWGE